MRRAVSAVVGVFLTAMELGHSAGHQRGRVDSLLERSGSSGPAGWAPQQPNAPPRLFNGHGQAVLGMAGGQQAPRASSA